MLIWCSCFPFEPSLYYMLRWGLIPLMSHIYLNTYTPPHIKTLSIFLLIPFRNIHTRAKGMNLDTNLICQIKIYLCLILNLCRPLEIILIGFYFLFNFVVRICIIIVREGGPLKLWCGRIWWNYYLRRCYLWIIRSIMTCQRLSIKITYCLSLLCDIQPCN